MPAPVLAPGCRAARLTLSTPTRPRPAAPPAAVGERLCPCVGPWAAAVAGGPLSREKRTVFFACCPYIYRAVCTWLRHCLQDLSSSSSICRWWRWGFIGVWTGMQPPRQEPAHAAHACTYSIGCRAHA